MPKPVPFAETISARIDAHSEFIEGEDEENIVKGVQHLASGFLEESHHAFDSEMVQEREQEQEQEQEQEVSVECHYVFAFLNE